MFQEGVGPFSGTKSQLRAPRSNRKTTVKCALALNAMYTRSATDYEAGSLADTKTFLFSTIWTSIAV
eukprot:1305950-Rhodomonas_salina.2